MAAHNGDDLVQGWEVGLIRAHNEDVDIHDERTALTLAAEVATAWPGELSDRMVRRFAEDVALAAQARSSGGDPALTRDDVQGHLQHMIAFLASWNRD